MNEVKKAIEEIRDLSDALVSPAYHLFVPANLVMKAIAPWHGMTSPQQVA